MSPEPKTAPEQKPQSPQTPEVPSWQRQAALIGAVAALLSALAAWIIPILTQRSERQIQIQKPSPTPVENRTPAPTSTALQPAQLNQTPAITPKKKSPPEAKKNTPSQCGDPDPNLVGIPVRCKALTPIAQLGWDGGKSTEYARRTGFQAEAVSDSGYFGGVNNDEAKDMRSAIRIALAKCKYYVTGNGKTDPETCAIIMINDQKVGKW